MKAAAETRRRIYHLEAEPFEQIGHWVESFERLWEVRLDLLGRYLDSITRERTEDGSEERH